MRRTTVDTTHQSRGAISDTTRDAARDATRRTERYEREMQSAARRDAMRRGARGLARCGQAPRDATQSA